MVIGKSSMQQQEWSNPFFFCLAKCIDVYFHAIYLIILGFHGSSPGLQSPFFAPIQPAPLQQSNATVFNTTHAATAPPVNSDIISMLRHQQQNKVENEDSSRKVTLCL